MSGEGPAALAEACATFRELASAEIDSELTPDEASAIHDHLPSCEPCRVARGRLQWVVGLVHALRGALVLVAFLVVAGPSAFAQDPPADPPADARETAPVPLVSLEEAALVRMRLEHKVRAEVVLRNTSPLAQRTRARLVAFPEGVEQAGPWTDLGALPPGRWAAVALDVVQCPEFEAWRVEVDAGGTLLRYEAESPTATPRLVRDANPGEQQTPEAREGAASPRVGVRGAWIEGPDGAHAFVMRVCVAGEPKEALVGATVSVVTRGEGRRLGTSRARLDVRDLRRAAGRLDWRVAPPGTLAWDEAEGEAVVAVLRTPTKDDLTLTFDVAVALKDGRRFSFDELGPPYRNDPVPGAK